MTFSSDLADPGARRRFVGGVSFVYFLAFLSLAPQMPGLYGPEGIVPIEEMTQVLATRVGPVRYWEWPSVFWWGASDEVLVGAMLTAALVGLLPLLSRRMEAPGLLVAWVSLLSVVSIGRVFMSYQWDALLLEAGVLALLSCVPSTGTKDVLRILAAVLLRLLAIKLFFFSGISKLFSGDPVWMNASALQYHFETQPLPTWVGVWFHGLSAPMLQAGVVFTWLAQLVAPWTLLAPWSVRRFGVAVLLAHQVLIAVTGNYGFFNVLAAVLLWACVPEAAWRTLWPANLRALLADPSSTSKGGRGLRPVFASGLAMILVLNSAVWLQRLTQGAGPLITVQRWLQPLQLVHGYGLFADMTTERPEVVVEVSDDGRRWHPVDFRFKPRPGRPPAFVAPHQPRLDWQMWFAALRGAPPPWFGRFLRRVQQRSPAVLRLVRPLPVPGSDPLWVRARIERCRLHRPPQWWRCADSRIYFPALSPSDSVSLP